MKTFSIEETAFYDPDSRNKEKQTPSQQLVTAENQVDNFSHLFITYALRTMALVIIMIAISTLVTHKYEAELFGPIGIMAVGFFVINQMMADFIGKSAATSASAALDMIEHNTRLEVERFSLINEAEVQDQRLEGETAQLLRKQAFYNEVLMASLLSLSSAFVVLTTADKTNSELLFSIKTLLEQPPAAVVQYALMASSVAAVVNIKRCVDSRKILRAKKANRWKKFVN